MTGKNHTVGRGFVGLRRHTGGIQRGGRGFRKRGSDQVKILQHTKWAQCRPIVCPQGDPF